MKNRLNIFVFVCYLLFPVVQAEQRHITLPLQQDSLGLGLFLDLYEDVNHELTIDKLLNKVELQVQFVPSNQSIPHGGITSSSFWARFYIKNPLNETLNYLLEFDNPPVDYVNLIRIGPEGYEVYPPQGDQLAFGERPLTDSPLFHLNIPPGEHVFYLHYRSLHNAHSMPLILWQPQAYDTNFTHKMIFHAAVLGCMLSFGFYNFFIYWRIRQKMYLYYVLYIFSVVASILITSGLLKMLFLRNAGPMLVFSEGYPISTNLNGIFIGLFALHFLDMNQTQPRLARLLRGTVLGLTLATGVIFWDMGLGIHVSLPLGLILVILLIATAFRSVIQGFRPGWFYLVSWLLVLVAAGFWLLSFYGIGLTTEHAMRLLRLFLACEAVLIAIGMADKIRLEQRHTQERVAASLRQIEDLNKALQQKEAARTAFFHNTSHELRTPLHGILGFLDLVMHGNFGNIPEQARQQLRKAYNLAHSLKLQVNGILELAKSRRKELELYCSRIPLDDLVEEIGILAEGLALKSVQTNFTISKSWPEIQRPSFVGDYEKILTAVRNLVGNAFKFSAKDRKNHVELRFSYIHNALTIEVQDQGIGFNMNQIERIFEEFGQLNDSSKRRFEGTGIGLALVREYMELMDGKIEVQSHEGQGSSFTLLIPEQQIDQDAPLLRREMQDRWSDSETAAVDVQGLKQLRSQANTSEKILIVDDNPINGEIMAKMLEPQGYETLYVGSGQQALEACDGFAPDLILLDMMMPEMSGEDVLRELQKHQQWRRIPVVVVTARAHDDDRIAALRAGADEYLAKPIIPDELFLRVRNVLARKNLVKELIQRAAQVGQMKAARQVQNALIQDKFDVPGLEFASFYTAAEETGGDWYGVHYEAATSQVFLFIGDVTGHGISSALLTGVAHGAIKGILNYSAKEQAALSLEDLLLQLARSVDQTVSDLAQKADRWITMVCIGIDLKQGNGLLLNAGHHGAYLIRDEKASLLMSRGSPLGIGGKPSFNAVKFRFDQGDRLFLYTDGLVENVRTGSKTWSARSLEKLLVSSQETEQVRLNIVSAYHKREGFIQDDDTSFLLVKRIASLQQFDRNKNQKSDQAS